MKNFLLKKQIVLLLILVTIASLSTACQNESTETIELSLAHFFPGTHPAETEFVQGWANAIEEATDGLVVVTSYPGGTLLQAADTYNGVVNGVADLGLSCFAYTRGRFPVLEAFELPGIIYEKSKVASKVAWEGIQQINPDEIQDTKLLMVIATGPGDLFTKDPITNLADIQGYEIRATGLSATTIEALGGIPVGMPQSEAYEALSKGIVKGNLSPVEVLKGWKHAEVTNYITKTPFLYNTLFYVTMNLEKWNSIPTNIQKIIIETTDTFYNETGIGLWDKQNEAGLSFAINEQEMEIIELSSDEITLWIDKVTSVQDTYNETIRALGINDDIIKIIEDLANKYNDIY